VNEDTRKDLLISIATACGEPDEEGIGLDKKDYWTRLQWADEFLQTPYARAMVDYPMDYLYWTEDKIAEPFQFLAFCKEFFDIFVDEVKDTCDVFVFRDATTSGLQILAGLMRDEKSALYTNVIHTDEPMDAYRLVADKAKELMRDPTYMNEQFARRGDLETKKNAQRDADNQLECRGSLFEFDIDVLNRAHTKTQVMTTLYNSSPLTRRDNILSALKKKNQIELHPGDKGIVVSSCIQAMAQEFEKALELNKWFQDVARAAMDAGKEHLKWITPSGMFVVNEYREPLFTQVTTHAAGGGHYSRLMRDDNNKVFLQSGWGDVKKSKVLSSTSANYIHSLDASIIVLGVLEVSEDLPVFTVHDCIACVPGTLSEVIPVFRKAFHNVVTSNPLMGLLEENELDDIITIPEQGDADISQCLDSPYMFS
jgi:DNA-directed RNA polymerase